VAIHGDVAAVGDPARKTKFGDSAGAVYVFRHGAYGWVQQAELFGWDVKPGNGFGWAAAISDDMLVIGTPGEYDVPGSGRVYSYYRYERTSTGWTQRASTSKGQVDVFRRTDTGWNAEATLTAKFNISYQQAPQFGWAVTVSGETVRAPPRANTSRGARTGAAYVFVRQGGVWSQQAQLVGSDVAANDQSGSAVSIDAETLAVGSPGHGSDSGAVYIFVRSGASWSEQAILRAASTAPNDRLGYSVALSCQLVVAGAPGRQSSAEKSGYACVFVCTGTTWSPPAQLLPPSPQTPSRFGTSVAIIDGGHVLVGDPVARKAYVFALANGTWKQTDVLDGILVKSFGSSLRHIGCYGSGWRTHSGRSSRGKRCGAGIQPRIGAGEWFPTTSDVNSSRATADAG
jgi:hypothetical protein